MLASLTLLLARPVSAAKRKSLTLLRFILPEPPAGVVETVVLNGDMNDTSISRPQKRRKHHEHEGTNGGDSICPPSVTVDLVEEVRRFAGILATSIDAITLSNDDEKEANLL
jgi:hypothetical protein